MPNEVRELIARHLLDVLMPPDSGTRSRVVGGIDVSGRTGLEQRGIDQISELRGLDSSPFIDVGQRQSYDVAP
jgi:hypothetical protein